MQYFQTNFQTLTEIAKLCGFDGLAGYLVLARHATGHVVLNYPNHTLSGAGVNSIHEKLGCSELRAKAILNSLIQHEFVTPAPADAAAAAPRSARWFLPKQHPLNTDLPHSLVDAAATHEATSPLRRLKKLEPLPGQDKSSANCDGTMLLLAMYFRNQMHSFGGLPVTTTVFREWETVSVKKTETNNNFVWTAIALKENAYSAFIKEALPHVQELDECKRRFWQALKNIKSSGLIYEVVTLFEATEATKILVSLRVNDFHAGAIDRPVSGDPSLLRVLETEFNTRFAFYDSSGEEETLRVELPYESGKIFGVLRLRFRTANKDTGQWIEEEEERVSTVFDMICSGIQPTQYDDDF